MPRSANEILGDLIRISCPSNWGGRQESAEIWLEAEAATGVTLPDSDSIDNLHARQGKFDEGSWPEFASSRRKPK